MPTSIEKDDELKDSKIYIKCHTCKRDYQSAEVLTRVLKKDWTDDDEFPMSRGGRYETVKCCGCESVFFRETTWDSEDIDYKDNEDGSFSSWEKETETLHPPENNERNTIGSFHLVPEGIQAIYIETASALQYGNLILTGIGIRIIIEIICEDKKTTSSKLWQKINELHTTEVLAKKSAAFLHQLRLLGNQSAHEGRRHDPKQLSAALDGIDHLLENIYVLPQLLDRYFPKTP